MTEEFFADPLPSHPVLLYHKWMTTCPLWPKQIAQASSHEGQRYRKIRKDKETANEGQIMARPSKKAEIVQAAAELFSTKGFKATTVRDIAEKAGVLSGSLYAHIDTKEDLLLEIVRLAANEFANALEPIVRSDENPEAKVRAAVHAHLGVIASSRAWSTVYLDEDAAFSPEGRLEVRQLRKVYEQYWMQILEEGRARQTFSFTDSVLTRLFILSALNGFHRWYDPQGRLTVHDIAEDYAGMILNMLRKT